MAPTPQEFSASERGADEGREAGERVVISGMSGLFPNARHVADFADILYNKVNPVTSENARFNYSHPEVTQYTGKVPDLNYFDAQFFKVHYRLANSMDIMGRKILEQAYQAIYDAGVSPEHLSGKKVGVYIGTCFSETEKACFYVTTARTGFGITGCSKTMFANRISYWLNVKGPSMAVDQACCSSAAALQMAHTDIQRGVCEAAVVGGTNLCLHPQTLVHYARAMKINKDGKTKSFDENADGCAKSEAINVLFLQKAQDALRIYAEVVHVKTQYNALVQDETGPRYGFYRNPEHTTEFLKRFYEEAQVPPQSVEYVEAWGSAVLDADKAELEAIDNIFCNGRSTPLLVGSVMSNVGYAEAASGITAITKVILGYHTGELAANLHCATPRRDVAALRDGRMRVATQHARCRRSYVAINGLSFTGVNAHILLHGHYKRKDLSRYKSDIPHLVLVSGRQESAVNKVLDDLKLRSIDPEEIALLNNIHTTRISGHLGRGFIILGQNENQTISFGKEVSYFDYVKRPLWFVYSGMGSQWPGMGQHFMQIPIFAAAIERCKRVLEPKGVDIVNIITSNDTNIFDNILNSFVGIAAIQIGLTDILREIGLLPDKIIGHSVGELGCAYADGCFTAEEMILSAYCRGLVSVQTPFIRGSMAAVGIGFEQMSNMCPPEIEVACHNGPDSCTISGPADVMREFVAKLTDQGIFAKEVPCSNIAYHSRYIAEAGPQLLKYLSEVITAPKARSERWVSTSVPMDRWDEDSAKYSSAEYHTNNLLRPVLFEESARLVPVNAVLVEVAPHGLLQAILKRSLPAACSNVPLARRGHPDNAVLLLNAIGKLYLEGFNPVIKNLYPKIDFPVSTGTPMLSHLVEWAHSEKWDLPFYSSALRKSAAATTTVISIHDAEHAYLTGHVINGQVLYPFAAALVAVWDTLAMVEGAARRRLPVALRDVALHAQPVLHARRALRLAVALHRGTGRFEVMDDINSTVATGFINSEDFNDSSNPTEGSNKYLEIGSKEIYNGFFLRDFHYRDGFKSIYSVNSTLTEAYILWRENWVTFLDGIIQFHSLRHSLDSHNRPTFIDKVIINPEEQYENKNTIKKATILDTLNLTRCGGILMGNVKFRDLQLPQTLATLRPLKFIPHFTINQFTFETIIQVYMQIVKENIEGDEVNILGLYDNNKTLSKLDEIRSILEAVPEVNTQYKWIESTRLSEHHEEFLSDFNIIIVFNMAAGNTKSQILPQVLQCNTFVIDIRETTLNHINSTQAGAFNPIICGHSVKSAYLELAYWQPTHATERSAVITVNTSSDFPLMSDKLEALLPYQKLLILTTHPAPAGLKEYLHYCNNKYGSKSRLAMSNNGHYGGLDIESLTNLRLSVVVFQNGVAGGDYLVPLQNTTNIGKDVMLHSTVIGQLESLHWNEAPLDEEAGILVEVHYAGLNDLDSKRAAGIIPFDSNKGYGMDFSGITESGTRVMGLVAGGAVKSRVRAPPAQLWPVPAHWSLEDAATVPLAYCLAYYCLTILYPLYCGKRVLVHSGAGALGQAIIAIALANDCEVFATVGDDRKKQFLIKIFPELKAKNIGNSRDFTFFDMVLDMTNGKGVDFAICNLNGDLKTASLKCVGSTGVMVDVAQIPQNERYMFGLSHLVNERSYALVDFYSIFNETEKTTMKRLQRAVGEGVARGWVRPLTRAVYEPHQGARALRLLAAGNQRGRALLRLRDELGAPPRALPRIQCSTDKLHVIISDHLCLGQHLADTLISHGVRKMSLYLPTSPNDLKLKRRQWERTGVQASCEVFVNLNSNDVLKVFVGSGSFQTVEGVYIIISNKYTPVLESISFVDKIDTMTRKLYPDLRYFAVLNTVNSVGAEICMSRTQNRFAGTMIRFPEIKDIGEHDVQCAVHAQCVDDNQCTDDAQCTDDVQCREDVQCMVALEEAKGVASVQLTARDAVAAAAHALVTAEPVLAARTPRPCLSLLQQLAHVAGVTIHDDIEGTTTFADLVQDPVKLKSIYLFLRDVYNVFLKTEDIQSLTVKRVQKIDEVLTKTEFDDEKGLSTLFSYVDSDELMATSEMVFLPTLWSYSCMRDNEFDVNETFLCIVPGVEGHHARFRALCERLKLPALVLQPGLHHPHDSVQQTARRYAKILLEKTCLKTNFYLMGYESGVLVVLELAALLEDHGLTGTVFCLGAPPAEFGMELRWHLRGLETEEALQDAVVRHMFALMAGPAAAGELEGALRGAVAWRDKVEAAVRLLLGRVSHSAQYTRQLIEAAHGRLAALLRHEGAARALRSRLVLLRPAPAPACASALQPHSQRPVTAHALRAPLALAPQDLRCAAIINSYLDDHVLRAFDQRNLCESYLLKTDNYMSSAIMQ